MGRIPPPPKKRGFQLPVNQVVCGSNIEVVFDWPAECVDSIVTDPPYGIGFMGKTWDTYSDKSLEHYHINHDFSHNKRAKKDSAFTTRATAAGSYDFSPQGQMRFYDWMLMWSKAMLRITKPGGFLFCFGGTRTYHRLACAIEDAGWEIRDCMMWLYGSGFPKSHNIGKKVDGWNGYGTALKPAWEPIIIAMKPIDGTFANNAEKYGVAGLNIDGGRINHNEETRRSVAGFAAKSEIYHNDKKYKIDTTKNELKGRWPANLILDEEAGKMLDEQSGVIKGEIGRAGRKSGGNYNATSYKVGVVTKTGIKDSGGASRFFYCAKVSKKERNLGMEDQKNNHPTVKPLALIKYLCTLLKMPNQNQIILDPFMGSGTTGMACKELGINFIGIEKEQEYCEIAKKRIAAINRGTGMEKNATGTELK